MPPHARVGDLPLQLQHNTVCSGAIPTTNHHAWDWQGHQHLAHVDSAHSETMYLLAVSTIAKQVTSLLSVMAWAALAQAMGLGK